MEKTFWADPYQRSLQTTITAIAGPRVLCAATIAFSFSGGQESDRTTIAGLEVSTSEIDGTDIWYTLPPDHGLQVGQTVSMVIDWPRRYRLMRLHFAAELVLELITRQYPWEKVGAHIAENKARIDFQCDQNISSIFPEILDAYTAIIAADLPIETGFSDLSTQRRYWKITGFAQVPCGGTHVRSTAEVGAITLKRARPGRGIERIEILLVPPPTSV